MLKIKWLGQGGYILSDGKTEICIDPYLSDVGNRVAGRPRTRAVPILPEKLKSDVVICTHNHLDHIDTDAIPLMKKEKMLFLSPSENEETLREMGVCNFKGFDVGDGFEIGDLALEAVYAEHTVTAIGVTVSYNGETLYFSGDTEYSERLEAIKCDYMFVCINGRLGNMKVEEAVKLGRIINPKVAVPNHYDMFESNSEDPEKLDLSQRFIMDFNREYLIGNGKITLSEE